MEFETGNLPWRFDLEIHDGSFWGFRFFWFGVVLNMPITQLSWDLCPQMKSSAICNNLLLLLLLVPDLVVWGKFSLLQELCLESEYHHHDHVRITPLIQMLQRCWKGRPGYLSHCGGWGQCLTQWGHQTVVQYDSKSSFLLKEALKLLISRFCSICHQNIHPNPGFMVRRSYRWTIYIYCHLLNLLSILSN
jgi:hypothetical protein